MASRRHKLAVLGLVVATLALYVPRAFAGFSTSSLKGSFVIGTRGFDIDENGDAGELGLNGVITLDGFGNVTAIDLQVTGGDTNSGAVDQFTCEATGALGSGPFGNYFLVADGRGDLNLDFHNAVTSCVNASGDIQDAVLGFDMVVGSLTGSTPIIELISGGDPANDDDDISGIQDENGDDIADPAMQGKMRPQTASIKFSKLSLKHDFAIRMGGFSFSDSFERGQMNIDGVIQFDGKGTIPGGEVTVTEGDVSQVVEAFGGGGIECDDVGLTGFYSVSPNGVAFVTITLSTGLDGFCNDGDVNNATLSFVAALATPLTYFNPVLSTTFNGGFDDDFGADITNLVMSGEMEQQFPITDFGSVE